jgi:beta-glucosidase/6-phospho-beta-glucosidase/beta-galactosidase
MAECGHYDRWREDFDLALALGCRHLRYGPPLYRIHEGPGRYDWSFTDEVMPRCETSASRPSFDLCHFRRPDWIGDFQNADWPAYFAEYARAFAARYPWVRLYTPVNEMYITAEFSGYYGWWNERLASHRGFVGALRTVVLGSLAAMQAILEVRPDALFIHAESSEHTHANRPELAHEAEMFNERRFLTLDLICGHRISAGMYAYLRTTACRRRSMPDCAQSTSPSISSLGMTTTSRTSTCSSRRRHAERQARSSATRPSREPTRPLPSAGDAYGDKPRAGTAGDEAANWLWKTWANVQQLRREGVPICGMTWYSLTDQIDWDVGLREKNGRVNPLGLYDLDRQLRPAGEAFRRLIEQWNDTPLLPYGPFSIIGGLDV